MPSVRAAGIAACFGLLASGCAPAPARVDWRIEFAGDVSPADARASIVHASIRTGGCSSTDSVYDAQLAFGEAGPTPPALSPGAWAFVAEAVDASCAVIASDCVAITIPEARGTTVVQLLRATDPYPLCPPSECSAGRCGLPDAGGDPDAAVPPDTGSAPDAGPPDAGPPDACAASETRCADGVDEDCDGAPDCADTECAGAACGATSVCCSGACVDTQISNAHCGGCGAPCDTSGRFTCVAGSCECETGFMECTAGACTNTTSSETNCGMCGRTCTPDLVCEGGACGPDSATWSTRRYLADCPGQVGATFRYSCPPNPTLSGVGSVTGTDTYYSLSSVCGAAVHAGRITAAAGGAITVRIADGGAPFAGTTRNGITSSSRSSGSCSFTLDP